MRFGKRPLLTTTILVQCLFAGMVSAGPVRVDEVETSVEPSDGAKGLALPSGMAQSPATGQAAAGGAVQGMPSPSGGGPGQSSSASALAAEIIKEAEAGATSSALATAEPPRASPRPGAQMPPQPPGATTRVRSTEARAEDDWGLREMSKAAVSWLQEAVPWLRTETAGDRGEGNASANPAEWTEPSLAGGAAARGVAGPGSERDPVQLAETSAALRGNPGDAGRYDERARADSIDTERNVVRQAIAFIREVLEHPMTWLVVALFVIGGIAMSKMDRRPK